MAGSQSSAVQRGEIVDIDVVACAALCLGAISTRTTMICGIPHTADTRTLAAALRAMGVTIEPGNDAWRVVGCGVGGLSSPDGPIELELDRVGTPLLMGLVAGHEMTAHISVEPERLQKSNAILAPLCRMGLEVTASPPESPVLVLRGTPDLVPVDHTGSLLSEEAAAATLLAGLLAPGRTTVCEPASSPSFMADLMRALGGSVAISIDGSSRCVAVTGHAELTGREIDLARMAFS